MDRLEKIKWLVNNPNPCIKCGQSSYCCGCSDYYRWKEKFDELNVDDITNEEANNVKEVLCLKKDLEKIYQKKLKKHLCCKEGGTPLLFYFWRKFSEYSDYQKPYRIRLHGTSHIYKIHSIYMRTRAHKLISHKF